MSENIPYYLPSDMSEHDKTILVRQLQNSSLVGPMFIGQGACGGCGSDCYGYYVVACKEISKTKKIWGIASACMKMHSTWEEGTMDCSINLGLAKPEFWVTSYGKLPSGKPKWWKCSEDGKRINGAQVKFNWNFAYGYRDPSF